MSNDIITILIGNGLGRAICPEEFTLSHAMRIVEQSNYTKLKSIYEKFKRKFPPTSEAELYETQELLFALDQIKQALKIAQNLFPNTEDFDEIFKPVELLENIHNYEGDFKSYCFEIANYFYQRSLELSKSNNVHLNQFIAKLAEFIIGRGRDNTHLATLNYDSFLYYNMLGSNLKNNQYIGESFKAEAENMYGDYKATYLCDGFWVKRDGFHEDHLNAKDNNKFALYLHLHGSPLFYEDKYGNINKLSTNEEIDWYLQNKTRRHFILSSTEHKQNLIEQSYVLKTYFDRFNGIVRNSTRIMILGYSGKDIHINKTLKQNPSAKFTIVEYDKNEKGTQYTESERKRYWITQLGVDEDKIQLLLKDNILNYDFQ